MCVPHACRSILPINNADIRDGSIKPDSRASAGAPGGARRGLSKPRRPRWRGLKLGWPHQSSQFPTQGVVQLLVLSNCASWMLERKALRPRAPRAADDLTPRGEHLSPPLEFPSLLQPSTRARARASRRLALEIDFCFVCARFCFDRSVGPRRPYIVCTALSPIQHTHTHAPTHSAHLIGQMHVFAC